MIDPTELGTCVVRRAEVHTVAFPVTNTLTSAATSMQATRRAAYVKVELTGGVIGWGECVALEAPTYTPESTDDCVHQIVARLLPMLMASSPLTIDRLGPTLDRCLVGWPMAKAAVEAAVLDALLRRSEMSLATFLGARRSMVPAGAAVGIPAANDHPSALDVLLRDVNTRFDAGYQRVRVKVVPQAYGGNWLTAPLAHLRAQGVSGRLQPDGNCSFGMGHLDDLANLPSIGVDLVEQPFAAGHWLEHRALRERRTVRVIADEAVTSEDDANLALDIRGPFYDGLCIKWGRVGGILAAARTIELACGLGAPMFIGGMLGLGTWVDAALSGLIPDELDLVGDHGPSGKWIAADADPTPPMDWVTPGLIAVPQSVGVVDIDEKRLLTHRVVEPAAFD